MHPEHFSRYFLSQKASGHGIFPQKSEKVVKIAILEPKISDFGIGKFGVSVVPFWPEKFCPVGVTNHSRYVFTLVLYSCILHAKLAYTAWRGVCVNLCKA